MKTLKELCIPRKSIFDKSKRDTVLDLTDLMEDGKINPDDFFTENYLTNGFKNLYENVFKRFEGQSEDGVFRLTQTMGGGKTHSMIALGLMSKFPEFRHKIMGHFFQTTFEKTANVIAFSGRDTDTKYGIWGYIAEKLGKRDELANYYSPLQAPGQTTWVKLLKGEPLLILLDELPPYFNNAQAIQIGDSNLANVTATAITNLLMAVGKGELSNVAVVISDLTHNYAEGKAVMQSMFNDFNSEIGRVAKDFTPVKPNSDEIYLILRKRLFEDNFKDEDVKEIANAYRDAMKQAKQMDLTTESPDIFAGNVVSSFPFHPGIKDLFARFKENQGFQQTRGMIRLMRTFMSRMFDPKDGWADKSYLIHAFDFDLNDPDTLGELNNVNRDLINAITHDIANQGNAVAERIDTKLNSSLATDTAKTLLISSLTTVTSGLKGLNEIEIVRNIVKPSRVPSNIRSEAMIPLTTESWYLHTDRDGNTQYKDQKNIVAQLNTISSGYNEESVKKDLVKYLKDLFEPSLKDCYQQVYALPSLDDIQVSLEKIVLVIYTPHQFNGFHPELMRFYEDQAFKNRIMFLTGDNRSLVVVNQNAAQLKAIKQIISDLQAQKVATNSSEYIEAENLKEKIQFSFLSAVQQTFVKLWYPHAKGLKEDNFSMQFSGNIYNGEEQIRSTLKGSQKFTEDTTTDTFKLQCEMRLMSQKQMPWADIKRNAATDVRWQWHKTDALEQLKTDMIFKDQWRAEGNWIEKGPFPPPVTDVNIQRLQRDDDTGEVLLKINPIHGDIVYYEIGAEATTASEQVKNLKDFKTKELEISFLCVDSKNKHQTGKTYTWKNEITIKYRQFDNGDKKMLELQAAPHATIKYTTDGSNPLSMGGTYVAPFEIPTGTRLVLASAERKNIQSKELKVDINWNSSAKKPTIDLLKPLKWNKKQKFQDTNEVYKFFDVIKKYKAALSIINVSINDDDKWIELGLEDKIIVEVEKLENVIEALRTNIFGQGQISLHISAINFPTGQLFEDYINEMKLQFNGNEIEQ